VDTLSRIIKYPIPVIPSVLLLNDDSRCDFSKLRKIFWLAGLTSAKNLIAQHWLPPHTLDIYKCLIQLRDIIMLEISTARVNSAQILTLKIWTLSAEIISNYNAKSNDQEIDVFFFFCGFVFLSIMYPIVKRGRDW